LETGAPDDQSRDLLGVFAIDGAVVVRNAFDRVARDPGPPPAHITSALISYRLHRNALEIMHMTTSLPNDPIDPGLPLRRRATWVWMRSSTTSRWSATSWTCCATSPAQRGWGSRRC
jgi:hypothetical protein